MKTYRASVRIGGRIIEVRVQARGYFDAKAMIESQYGEGNIVSGPMEPPRG